MKILIDGRALQTYSRYRGIGRYVNQLLDIFGKDPRFTFLFFKNKEIPGSSNHTILINSPSKGITFSDRFLVPPILKKGNFDIYHSTAYALPGKIDKVRYFITLYDLTPIKYPEFSTKKNMFIFKKIVNSMKNADRIISISEKSKVDLASYSGIEKSRIFVVHNFVQPIINKKTELVIPFKSGDYIFYTGGTDGNKNLSSLVKSINLTGISLIVSGMIERKTKLKLKNLLKPESRDLIHFTGFVSDSELAFLYSNARLFVFPSLYEGFGYPPLEALLCGTPSVVSNRGSLPEVMGDAALYCEDTENVTDLSGKIRILWENKKLREELVLNGVKILKKFSKDKFINKMEKIYF